MLFTSPLPLLAQGASELRAFQAAVKEFEDGSYPLAEQELAEFIKAFPESARKPEAILYQAQAALKQKKYQMAAGLLSTNATVAGPLSDQYRYFLGEAYLQGTNFQSAANTFASISKDFTNSNYLLASSYGEAVARFKLKDWPRVIQLLQDPDGTFRKEAQLRPADELATRGVLLLAEALMEDGQYRAAEQKLNQLVGTDLLSALKWHREYLLCRIQLADHRPSEALANTTNLIAMAVASGQPGLLAQSFALQGGILEELNELDSAIEVYGKNLTESTPAENARQALLKITALTLAQNKVGEAALKLETFLAKHPEDTASAAALLTLGELHLRLHFDSMATNRLENASNAVALVTNHLQQALLDFEMIIASSSSSPLLGRAELDKGWALWADGRVVQSQMAFQLATDHLPHSEERAVARFKLGEAELYQKDYTNALRDFRSVLENFSDLPRVKAALFDQALYQIIRASVALGDLAGANDAMKKILEWYPHSFFSDRGMLLVGQHLAAVKRPSDARQVFAELLQRFPDSPLAPEIALAVARTYVQENDWLAAIRQYEAWLDRFDSNNLRPQVEFNRAWAYDRSGQTTNALSLFANFVARFPTNDLAARAQFWIGSFYFNQKDYEAAEKNFQDESKILLQNTNYSYQALMWAGRAAVARQGWGNAAIYFKRLVEDNNCPADIKAEAYFALGDTLTWQTADPANPLQKFADAKVAFDKIPTLYRTNRLVSSAWGRIGDCYLQLATQDPKEYENATNAYQQVLTPAADVSARSQAEVKLGLTLEAMAKTLKSTNEIAATLDSAYTHYANVLYEKNLFDGETPDAFWLKEAGLAASELAKRRQDWTVVMNVYKRLQSRLPSLRELLEKRIEVAKAEQARFERK